MGSRKKDKGLFGAVKGLLVLCAVANGLAACGSRDHGSELDWEKSRGNDPRFAYLMDADLEDQFLFSVNVTRVRNFFGSALDFVFPVTPVRLKLDKENNKLMIVTDDSRRAALMTFDVKEVEGRYEVDFASAENDLRLKGLVTTLGGRATVGNSGGMWKSTAAPKVAGLSQDNDTVVVDLDHEVQQVVVQRDIFGQPVRERTLSDKGNVFVRVALKRTSSIPKVAGETKTVGDALEQNLGYFPSSFASLGDPNAPIQVLPVSKGSGRDMELGPTTIYLKDFPKEFEKAARDAVDGWNNVFGTEIFRVAIAPADVDAGDPRHYVIKWFDNTDRSVVWAGSTRAAVNPADGSAYGGFIYIAGSTLIKEFSGLAKLSKEVKKGGIKLVGQIGNVEFDRAEGETPVLPYFIDEPNNVQNFFNQFYTGVISHELGHLVGLRHNFVASTNVDGVGEIPSVMDYVPANQLKAGHGPGSYDRAAIRWAYFGKEPQQRAPYCSDEDVDKTWNCNRGDMGDPIHFVTHGIVDGTAVLAQKGIDFRKTQYFQGLFTLVETAGKIMTLKSQLSEAQRKEAEEKIPAAFRYMINAKPFPDLSGSDKEIAERNLKAIRDVVGADEDSSKEDPDEDQ